ncbi:hypothetical protein GYMC10_6012 [Paenibacillus sp. Y412MC10]|nr:hypothetical protein GYMC10_6012 [Paenibacillus sp. Y412MC10]
MIKGRIKLMRLIRPFIVGLASYVMEKHQCIGLNRLRITCSRYSWHPGNPTTC